VRAAEEEEEEPPIEEENETAISLDAMRRRGGAFNLGVSRLFALGGYQLLGHVARPGMPSITAQIAALPKDRRYVLYEDDRMTGGTLRFLRAALEEHEVAIEGARLAFETEDDEDVIDSRDFLLGTDDGGLVVELPDGSIARAPYVLPWVDPAARASIGSAHALTFSRRVWALNEAIFRSTTNHYRVADLPAPQRALLQASRFTDRDRLADVCRAIADRLATYSSYS